jgi:lauroyl/myristoyl acyltransferase
MQFGGESKTWIHRLRFPYPEFGKMRLYVTVERGVDLHHVKTARQNFEGMLLAMLHSGRVEDSFPVLVRPASSADSDWGGSVQEASEV